jgi:hypothetical protein
MSGVLPDVVDPQYVTTYVVDREYPEIDRCLTYGRISVDRRCRMTNAALNKR